MDSKTLNSPPTSLTSASKLLFASAAPSCQPPLPPRFDRLDQLRSMSCSIPNTVGSSDWLSRRRASRGIPDTDNSSLKTFMCSIRKDDFETRAETVLLKTPQLEKHKDGEGMQGRDDNADGRSLLVPRSSRGFRDTDNISLESFLCSTKKDDSETCTESVLLKTPQLDKHEDGEDMQGRDDNADGKSLLAPRSSRSYLVMDSLEAFLCREMYTANVRLKTPKLDKHEDGEHMQGRDDNADGKSLLAPRSSRGFPDTDSLKYCSIKKDTESVLLKTPQLGKHEDGEDMHGRDDNADGNSLLAPLTWNCKRKRTVKKAKVADPVEEEEKGHLDLLGCSQTKFTVIDTSLPSWKSEKMLYRRKNIRKVGDKKGKGSKRRYRKKSLTENNEARLRDDDNVLSKPQGCEKQKNLSNSAKYVDRGNARIRSKRAQGHDQGKAMVAASEKKHDNCSKVQEKRVLKKHIDGGSSSVVLIKSIPITNKKDVSSKSGVKLQKMTGSGGAKQL